jgi:hypothetical protein
MRRHGGFLPRQERQGRVVHHASQEAGFRRGAGAVRRFRGRTLQRGRGGGIETLRQTFNLDLSSPFQAADFAVYDARHVKI